MVKIIIIVKAKKIRKKIMSSISRLLTRSKEKISFDELNSLAFLSSPIATLLVDEKGMILMVNHVFSQLTGYAKREVVGKNMSLLKSGTYNNAFYQAFWTRMSQTMQHDYEILNRCKDNTVILMRERIMRIDKGTKKYFVVTIEDITEDKKQVEKQHYLAMHDALTGLANRTLLNDRFTHTRLNTVSKGNKMGVLVCDI
ncbi:MAG: PAS domain S-box protein, partial [Sulfurimonas sp.]|nr:PAS domain S-box protein [Sulfurimonas sp.]